MSLVELANPDRTDKNTVHSYLPVYEYFFSPYRTTAKRVLEVGVERGGSLELWSKYFPNANILGLDITPTDKLPAFLKDVPRVQVVGGVNAYNTKIVADLVQQGIYFDILIDDGPHTLESMCFFAKYYSQLLAPGGILVIEDIPSNDWVHAIYGCVPSHFKKYCEAYDLTHNKERWDDRIFIIHLPSVEMPAGLKGSRIYL